DSVGAATYDGSLGALKRFGTMVSYGQASGKPPEVDLGDLSKRGSLFITRPTLMHYMAKRDDLEHSAAELFDVVGSHAVEIAIGQRTPLKDAAEAHRALEARETTGATILTV
ncbi:MAG: zinc-binding dehydrogenase, partial [Pseudomonadota bacterium]